MRALRDFNLPKIVTDDVTIIMGLIGDLFPALNVPRKRDMEFEDYVKKSMLVGLYTYRKAFMHKFDSLQLINHFYHICTHIHTGSWITSRGPLCSEGSSA